MNRYYFALGVLWRLLLLAALSGAGAYIYLKTSNWLFLLVVLLIQVVVFFSLYHYLTGLNRKLTRFLEAVRYSDFALAFRADDRLGTSFRDLNQQFNEVLEAFRQARAEKEANLHYVNTIVQHVGVGLLTYDNTGNVEMVNQAALRLLGIYRLRKLSELQSAHPQLLTILQTTQISTPAVYRTAQEQEITVRCSVVSLRGRPVTIVSLQNIRSELQQKELDAWQNLTKVLRHEIMNSITPIVSLVGTMQLIVNEELNGASDDSVGDLRDALKTIEQRGNGIMRFVEAYRSFTAIPQPRLSEISVAELLRYVIQLVQPDMQQRNIRFVAPLPSAQLTVMADAGQIEMVLINLLKNAVESLSETTSPTVQLETEVSEGRTIIRVSDNGPGIEPEALEKIFIPFFTTKKTGSGIGLSLSRQIMQLHGGQLKVESTPGEGSVFFMIF